MPLSPLRRAGALALLCTVPLVPCSLSAQVTDAVPHLINYQGFLTDSLEMPVEDGEYVVRFTIWSDSTSISPSDREWISPNCTVLVVNGLFNWQLGANENLPPWTIANHADLWVGTAVDNGAELTPRIRLCSAPYAYKAWKAEWAGYADSAGVVLVTTPGCTGTEQGATTGTGSYTITFPVTFSVPPYFSASAVVVSGANSGKVCRINAAVPGTGSAQIDLQYWDGATWQDVGSGVQVQVSYTAIAK